MQFPHPRFSKNPDFVEPDRSARDRPAVSLLSQNFRVARSRAEVGSSPFCTALFVATALLASTLSANLGHASDYRSARTAGLGGAAHAQPGYADALMLNPSALALMSGSAISADVVLNSPSTIGLISATSSSLLLPVQMGVAYLKRTDASFGYFGIAKQLLSRVALGVAGELVSGTSTQADGSVSASVVPFDSLRFAVVGDHLFSSNGLAPEYTLAVKWKPDPMLTLYVDPHTVPSLGNPLGLEAGLEVHLLEYAFARLGGSTNSILPSLAQRGDSLGLGAGLMFPMFSVDIGVTRTLVPVTDFSANLGAAVFL